MTPEEIRNEHAKLIATWFNTVGAAIIAAGTFVPAAQAIFSILPPSVDNGLVVGIGGVCVAAGIALHLMGHLVLGALLR
ncbi:hypothetical protein JQ625_32970 [Bradyrhizobium diazoefficiens]|nr:hypothetical protein [Bradyrhizobium diazoefficiens]MBR0779658.1 hypothetical protein [Bradyrhizobium diazoefficiens]